MKVFGWILAVVGMVFLAGGTRQIFLTDNPTQASGFGNLLGGMAISALALIGGIVILIKKRPSSTK